MKKKSIFLGLALATVAVVSLSSCKFFDQKKTTTKTTPTTTVIPTTTGTDPITTGTTPTTTVTDPVTTGTTPITTGTDPVTSTEVTPTTTGEDPVGPTIDVLTPEEEDDFEGYIQIKSVSDFLSFRDDAEANVNKNAILLCDIDLEGYVLEDAAIQLYTGIFNGRGHAIKNAALTLKGNKCGLLFKSVSGGTVTNTRFVGCSVDGGNMQGIGMVTGLAGGSSKFTQLEFNACTVVGGPYASFITGEANEVANTYGAAAPIIFKEITVKNNSSTYNSQYGGLLVGDVNGSATIQMSDLDIKGSFKGSSGNGSFLAGRCRAGCTIKVSNAIIDAEHIETPAKNGVITGGGEQAITLECTNVYIKNSATATIGGNNKDGKITATINNCYYNAENAAEAAKMITNGPDSGFVSVETATATADWLEETLGLDFEDVWTKEGDGLYRLQASSTNVKSADATLAKIVVSTGGAKLRYHKGDTFTQDGLVVFATYSDGVQLVATGFETTGYDMSTAGAQEVTVSYTEGGITKTTVFDIMVAEQTGFVIDDSFMVKTYVTGQDLDVKNLLVYSQWSDNVLEKLDAKEYTVDSTAYNKDQAGEYTLKVSNSEYAAQDVVVTVIDTKPVVVDNYIYVNVSQDATADGVLVNGVETFKSITAAINYLTACKYDAAVNKVIYVAPGTYEEKIDTSLDNLHLIGTSTNYNDTIITYSAVESTKNPLTGVAYSLNAVDCATVHVNGTGFEAANISIRNDFDYIANTQTNAETSPQGLALTINGDGAVLYNVHLFGNQDTLYLKSGRTYCKSCLIEGNVDFIFGQDTGIALFEDCTINAVYRGETNNTGYVTAMKVQESTAKPEFGYVFLNCNLTADANVRDGSMSLGRPWGQYATVAYISCNFSSAYSKVDYDGTSKSRWFSMTGSPVDADFAEYNSQGDGAITEAVVGGKILTAEQAERYTIANILAQQNGTAPKFSLAVNFVQELQELMAEAQGTEATTAIYAQGETGDQITATVAVQAELDLGVFVRNWNANNKVIEAEIADDTVVSYNNGVITGLSAGTTTITLKQGELTAVVTVTVVDAAIWTVTFNTDGTEVAEQSIVDGYTIDATAITTTKEGAVFKGWYKDADFEEAFDVVNDTIKADTVLYARFVDWADMYKEDITMYFDGTEGDGVNSFTYTNTDQTAATYNGLTVSGKFVYRSANNDTQFNNNVSVSFNVGQYATITLTQKAAFAVKVELDDTEVTPTITDNVVTYTTDKAGVLKITNTAGGNKYLTGLSVTYPTYIEKSTNISFGSEGNYKTVDGLTYTAVTRDNGTNNCQLGNVDGEVSFYVNAGATINIASYSGYTAYKITVDGVESAEQTGTSYSVTATTKTKVVIKSTTSNNYFYSIGIVYPTVIKEDTNITFGAAGNYKTIDGLTYTAVSRDNGDDNCQLGNVDGEVSFNVKAGAKIDIASYSGYTAYKITVDGVESEEQTGTSYSVTATTDTKVIIKSTNSNNYFYSIAITYSTEPQIVIYNEKFDATTFTNEAADKENFTQADLGTDSFFTFVIDASSSSAQKRSSSTGGAVTSVEFKNAGLQFTVENEVTVTIVSASTGGTNMSLLAVLDGEGNAVAATSVTRAEGDVIGVTGNVYDVYSSGTSTTFTYTLAAGTYTIKGMTGSSTGGTYSGTAKASESISRPVRIMSVTVVNAE